MIRLPLNRQATLTLHTFDENAEPADAAQLPTVRVLDADGSLLDAGDSVKRADSTGVYDFTVDAAELNTLGELTAEWTEPGVGVDIIRHEVVGSHLFALGELRRLEPLEDAALYTADVLALARDVATYALEDACRTAFTRRRAVETWYDIGKFGTLERSRNAHIVAAAYGSDKTAVGDDTLSMWHIAPGGLVHGVGRPGFMYAAPVVVTYEYGHTFAPPRAVRAAKLLAREWAQENVDTALPQRATMIDSDAGSMRLVTAGEFGRGFDIPEVNAVVQAYGE